jgi:hypothetical protein
MVSLVHLKCKAGRCSVAVIAGIKLGLDALLELWLVCDELLGLQTVQQRKQADTVW